MSGKIGILLINLGTPRSSHPRDVYRYLIEFLTDGRVIDYPWLWRQLLVRGVIVPMRYRQSARSYQAIWTPNGSPLMVHAEALKRALQMQMGDEVIVESAMRYQEPSIKDKVDVLLKQSIKQLIIVPLFPQYASATTGSVHQEVMRILGTAQVIPKTVFIDQFATHPQFINAVCAIASRKPYESADHILFSFHGLPERHVKKADRQQWCLQKPTCCREQCPQNINCYSAQCYATAEAIAQQLAIPKEKYTIAFQSRLGKEQWLQPYTNAVIQDLARKKCRNVVVFCPSFVSDCLETIFEIGVEYAAEFKHSGGQALTLVEGLNADPVWVDALEHIIKDHLKKE